MKKEKQELLLLGVLLGIILGGVLFLSDSSVNLSGQATAVLQQDSYGGFEKAREPISTTLSGYWEDATVVTRYYAWGETQARIMEFTGTDSALQKLEDRLKGTVVEGVSSKQVGKWSTKSYRDGDTIIVFYGPQFADYDFGLDLFLNLIYDYKLNLIDTSYDMYFPDIEGYEKTIEGNEAIYESAQYSEKAKLTIYSGDREAIKNEISNRRKNGEIWKFFDHTWRFDANDEIFRKNVTYYNGRVRYNPISASSRNMYLWLSGDTMYVMDTLKGCCSFTLIGKLRTKLPMDKIYFANEESPRKIVNVKPLTISPYKDNVISTPYVFELSDGEYLELDGVTGLNAVRQVFFVQALETEVVLQVTYPDTERDVFGFTRVLEGETVEVYNRGVSYLLTVDEILSDSNVRFILTTGDE